MLITLLGVSAGAVTVLMATLPAQALSPSEFIAKASGPATAGQKSYGVPASVALGQAILESAWGESSLTKQSHAFFGIKCKPGGDNGPFTSRCVKKRTRECTPTCHYVDANFRAYRTDADSFRDHGRLLKTNTRYAKAFHYTRQSNHFITEVARAGYATDPDYAAKIIALMKKYDLYRFDSGSSTPTATWPILGRGSKGYRVSVAQHLLVAHGRRVDADGVYGAKTAAAVVAVQRSTGLAADGIVGPKTWVELTSPVVRSGSSGAAVKAAQVGLRAHGATLTLDGRFGAKTRSAVIAFQRRAKLRADGIVGAKTWAALVR